MAETTTWWLPPEVAWSAWEHRFLAAGDDFEAAWTLYTQVEHLADSDEKERQVTRMEKMAPKGSLRSKHDASYRAPLFVAYDEALDALRLRVWLFLVEHPAIDERVLTLRPIRWASAVSQEARMQVPGRLFQNPLFVYVVVSANASVLEGFLDGLDRIVVPQMNVLDAALGQDKLLVNDVMRLDLRRAMGAWARKRGLDKALKVQLMNASSGMREGEFFASQVRKTLGAPLPDMVTYWMEWEALWQASVKRRLKVTVPRNEALHVLARALEIELQVTS